MRIYVTWNILIKHVEDITTLLNIYLRALILVSLQIKLHDILIRISHQTIKPISMNIDIL